MKEWDYSEEIDFDEVYYNYVFYVFYGIYPLVLALNGLATSFNGLNISMPFGYNENRMIGRITVRFQ